MGQRVIALPCLEPNDILGVNTRQHLAQANAILDVRLHQLTGLEQDKIHEEYKALLDSIMDYLEILASIERIALMRSISRILNPSFTSSDFRFSRMIRHAFLD